MPSFGGFFSFKVIENREVPFALQSSAIPVAVRDLPGIDGDILVGRTSASLRMSRSTAAEGETLSGEVIIESAANLWLLNQVELDVPQNFRAYYDSARLETSQRKDGVVIKKIFPFSLVPSQAGDYSVRLKPLRYFDPQTKALNEARSEVYKVAVSPNPALKRASQAVGAEALSVSPRDSPAGIGSGELKYVEPYALEVLFENFSWQLLAMTSFAILGIGGIAIWIARNRKHYGARFECNSIETFQRTLALRLSEKVGFHVAPERAAIEGAIKELNLSAPQFEAIAWTIDRLYPLDEAPQGNIDNLDELCRRALDILS